MFRGFGLCEMADNRLTLDCLKKRHWQKCTVCIRRWSNLSKSINPFHTLRSIQFTTSHFLHVHGFWCHSCINHYMKMWNTEKKSYDLYCHNPCMKVQYRHPSGEMKYGFSRGHRLVADCEWLSFQLQQFYTSNIMVNPWLLWQNHRERLIKIPCLVVRTLIMEF